MKAHGGSARPREAVSAERLEHPYRVPERVAADRPRASERPARRPLVDALAIVALIGSVIAIALTFGRVSPMKQRWMFLEASASPTELGLHPSPLRTGEWRVEPLDDATGASALVNHEGEALAPPATIVARSAWVRDFVAVTRCKTDPSRGVQQCGIVFRFRDEAHYDLVRVDTRRKEVVLAAVDDGARERVLARAPAEATAGTWHELRVDARGGAVQIAWNGRKLIELVESVPSASGSVGLWAPASGVSWFDELAIEGRLESPRPLEIVPLLGRKRS